MRLKSQSKKWYALKRAREVASKTFEGQNMKIKIKTELPVRKVMVNDEAVLTQEFKSDSRALSSALALTSRCKGYGVVHRSLVSRRRLRLGAT